jgi:NAD(P)-dependent dehydrogenase (short-subunit alcohol dehydrogenase family)
MPKNSVALVTGAGRGIGRSIALALAAAGARVAITARSEGELAEVSGEIAAGGGTALAIVADLAEREAPGRVLAEVSDAWGHVQILVNNAGVGSSSSPRPLVDFDDDFWDLTLALNVTAPYRLIKLALPSMIAARWGRIINISSINAKIPALHGAAYTASKHALAGLTKVVAREYAEFGITANAICPGATATLMNDRRLDYDAARLNQTKEQLEAQTTPLGRRIQPDEVAPLAVFLAGRGAAAINGQLINVCGGTVMS